MKEELLLKLIDRLLDGDNVKPSNSEHPLIGSYVIIRCRNAGVHAGILKRWEGREVELSETRRLWYFKCESGHTLSGVALHGLTNDSKIAGQLNNIILTDACEIIPCSSEAERSIRNANEYNS